MRIHSRLKWFVAFAVIGYAASPAAAQTAAYTPPPPPPGAVAPAGEMNAAIAEADATLTTIENALNGAQQRLQKARHDHDVVRTLALNDVVSQLGAVHASAKMDKAAMVAAAGRGDIAAVRHHRALMKVRLARCLQLKTEADQAAGVGDVGPAGNLTTTTTTTDNGLPADPIPASFPGILPGNMPSVAGPGGVGGFLPPGAVSPTS